MGKRGFPPAPTALKIIRGNPGKRPLPEDEPKPTVGPPPCPDWLTEAGKEKWFDMAAKLDAIGVLTVIDGDALGRYCATWVRWRAACKFIEERGEIYTIKNRDGSPKCFWPFPQVAIANQLSQSLARLEREFGLTPSSRTLIKTEKKICDDAFTEWSRGAM